MKLPVHLLCEVLSRCHDARTANALTITCSKLHQLRSNPMAKALALVRHDFISADAAARAYPALKMQGLSCGENVLMAVLPAEIETVSLHLLRALAILFTCTRNRPLLRKLLLLNRPLRDINAVCCGSTALDNAVGYKQPDAVRLLLDHGADPRANGAVCLRYASNTVEKSLPLLLLGHEFPPEAINKAQRHACSQNNVFACTILLPLSSRGMEYNIMDAVCSAVDHGSLDVLHFLIAYKGEKVGRTSPQHMAYGLGLAACTGHAPSAALLLHQGGARLWSTYPKLYREMVLPAARLGHSHSAVRDG